MANDLRTYPSVADQKDGRNQIGDAQNLPIMVAKITTPHSTPGMVNYNETTLQSGVATCAYSANYLFGKKDLNFCGENRACKHHTEPNQKAKTNILHFPPNFAPCEKLPKEKLTEIAFSQMGKISFTKRSFLVSQHPDAGCPQIQVITTSILETLKRINTFNTGDTQSETQRKKLEKQYHLFKAGGRNSGQQKEGNPTGVQKIKCGFAEIKRTITNLPDEVLNHYKFTSFPEVNALLKLYHITADRTKEGARICRNNKLTYRIVDSNNKVGVPVKAGSLYSKPTLHFLEEKFQENERLRKSPKQKPKTLTDRVPSKKSMSLSDPILQLQKERITKRLLRNDGGPLHGIYFIAHRTRSVFNGSNVEKMHSASAIQGRRDKKGPQRENESGKLLPKKVASKPDIEKTPPPVQQKNRSDSDNNIFKYNTLLELLSLKGKRRTCSPLTFFKKEKETP